LARCNEANEAPFGAGRNREANRDRLDGRPRGVGGLRKRRAMEDAIQSEHGEEIVDVTIEESWFINGFSVHLNGMVVRKRDPKRNLLLPVSWRSGRWIAALTR
jgi:hypothetical protein